MAKKRRFTIFDKMDDDGVFDSNSANPSSGPLYAKEEYPKMLYHPEGARTITKAAEIILTPYGPQRVNEQSELIHRIVNNEAEEQLALDEGWHDLPSKAMLAGAEHAAEVGTTDPKDQQILEMAAMIARLQDQMNQMQAKSIGSNRAVGAKVGGNKAA